MPSATDIAAWIGAIAGVAALVWQIATWRKSSHNVKVTSTMSWFTYPDGSLSDDVVCVTARNVGAGPVTVTSWGIRLGPTREDMVVFRPLPLAATLPHRLEPGASMSVFIHAADVWRAEAEKGIPTSAMRAWVRLATDKQVFAKRGMPRRLA